MTTRLSGLLVFACVLAIVVASAVIAVRLVDSEATPAPAAASTATPRPATACLDSELPVPGPSEPQDAWARAKYILGADVAVLRPASVPGLLGVPSLLEACVHPDGGPRYTVLYRNGEEALVFSLGAGFGAWGNFPGPPTSTERLLVRGVPGTLLTTVEGGRRTAGLSWQEGGRWYQVKTLSTQLPNEQLIAIAEALTPAQ